MSIFYHSPLCPHVLIFVPTERSCPVSKVGGDSSEGMDSSSKSADSGSESTDSSGKGTDSGGEGADDGDEDVDDGGEGQ